MLEMENENSTSDSDDSTSSITFIIPVKHPIPEDESQYLSDANLMSNSSSSRTQSEDSLAEYPNRIARTADIRVFSTGETTEETLSGLTSYSTLESSEEV
jgi:hypothetical protein